MKGQNRQPEEKYQSPDPIHYARIPKLATRDRRLTALDFRLYSYYVDYCSADRSYPCWEGQRIIAEKLGAGKNSIGASRQRLVDLGYITCKREKLKYPMSRWVYEVIPTDIWDANAARFDDLTIKSLKDEHGDIVERDDMTISQLKELWKRNNGIRLKGL